MSSHYVLKIQYVNKPPETRNITARVTTIGREAGDIVLGDAQSSGRHAEIHFENDQVRVKDLGSTNGTFFNGQRVPEFTMQPGQGFSIGQTVMTLMAVQAAGRQGAGKTMIAMGGVPPRPPGPPGAPPGAPPRPAGAPPGFGAPPPAQAAGFGAPPPAQPAGFGAPPPQGPPPGGFGAPPPQGPPPGAFGAPPPQGPPPGGAFGAPPPQGPPPGGAFGAPPPQGPPGGGFGPPPGGGFGAPPPQGPPPGGAFGAPPPQNPMAPMGAFGAPMGGPPMNPMTMGGPAPTELRGDFTGTGGELFGKMFVGALLTAITFGIYGFWFFCNFQNYIAEKSSLGPTDHGTLRFRFEATGGQFFKLCLVQGLLTAITFYIYMPWAICKFNRFFAENIVARADDGTEYRGRFDGQGGEFFVLMLVQGLLTGITFYIYMPWAICKVRQWSTSKYKILRNGAEVGGFGYDATGGQLFATAIVGALLTAITFYIYLPWFIVKLRKFHLEHTTIELEGRRYRGGFSGEGGELFVIGLVGALLMAVTLYIYYFWFYAKLTKWEMSNTVFRLEGGGAAAMPGAPMGGGMLAGGGGGYGQPAFGPPMGQPMGQPGYGAPPQQGYGAPPQY